MQNYPLEATQIASEEALNHSHDFLDSTLETT